jgi:WD40 repeat protein
MQLRVYDVTAISDDGTPDLEMRGGAIRGDKGDTMRGDTAPRCIHILKGHEHAVVDIAWSIPTPTSQQLSQQLVSASLDGTAQVWNVSLLQVEQVRK